MTPILDLIALVFNQLMSGAKSQKLEQQKPTKQPTKVCRLSNMMSMKK